MAMVEVVLATAARGSEKVAAATSAVAITARLSEISKMWFILMSSFSRHQQSMASCGYTRRFGFQAAGISPTVRQGGQYQRECECLVRSCGCHDSGGAPLSTSIFTPARDGDRAGLSSGRQPGTRRRRYHRRLPPA